jgi:uncharacterized Zn finger protein (UPF0148 family)
MEIRGERRCKDCGTTWSYAETGSVACPDCGSLHSVGVDERMRQTDKPVELDLSAARGAVDERPLREVAALARNDARAYVRARGFISNGDLRPMAETYVAAQELAYVAAALERRRDVTENDPEGFYFYSLLGGADAGERPPASELPESLRHARGLAAAAAVRDYRREAVDWLDGADDPARRTLETLGEHGKRIEALDGEVPPETADALVVVAREIGTALRDGDDDALASARKRLARLAGE